MELTFEQKELQYRIDALDFALATLRGQQWECQKALMDSYRYLSGKKVEMSNGEIWWLIGNVREFANSLAIDGVAPNKDGTRPKNRLHREKVFIQDIKGIIE